MENLSTGELTLEASEDAAKRAIVLSWRGKSNARNPSQVLQPYFATVLAAATTRSLGVELDFSSLEHFNSSTITSIIQLIQESRSKGVRLSIVYDARVKWQKLSFDALRVFAKPDGLLELRTLG